MEQTWADTRTRTMHMSDLTYVPVPVQFSRDIYRYPNQKNRKMFFQKRFFYPMVPILKRAILDDAYLEGAPIEMRKRSVRFSK